MSKQQMGKGQQYGFYDADSKQFYVIPAQSEAEFRQFLQLMGIQDSSIASPPEPAYVEKYEDFDFVVNEIQNEADSPFSCQLY